MNLYTIWFGIEIKTSDICVLCLNLLIIISTLLYVIVCYFINKTKIQCNPII